MDLLTPIEAARRLSVSPITLRKWADKGLIQAITTPGGHRRYLLDEVERLLQRPNPRSRRPLQIMIVDDDRFACEVLQEQLAKLDTPVVTEIANNGFEAGRKLVAFMPDIILLDLMMPGLDGFEVCHRIKHDPATARIRVIAITGHPSPENLQRILSAGAETCLVKPVNHDELMEALNLPAA